MYPNRVNISLKISMNRNILFSTFPNKCLRKRNFINKYKIKTNMWDLNLYWKTKIIIHEYKQNKEEKIIKESKVKNNNDVVVNDDNNLF
jgi:hypothetical protein